MAQWGAPAASARLFAFENSCWLLKGAGNANLVFAYIGDDPRLVRATAASRLLVNATLLCRLSCCPKHCCLAKRRKYPPHMQHNPSSLTFQLSDRRQSAAACGANCAEDLIHTVLACFCSSQVGKVLRVRKLVCDAHSDDSPDQTLDARVWQRVIPWSDACAVYCQVSYVQDYLAPLLGRQYVHAGVRAHQITRLRLAAALHGGSVAAIVTSWPKSAAGATPGLRSST